MTTNNTTVSVSVPHSKQFNYAFAGVLGHDKIYQKVKNTEYWNKGHGVIDLSWWHGALTSPHKRISWLSW